MEVLNWLAENAGDICQIATCAALLIRPIRDKIMGTEDMLEGLRCLLRTEIVRIYYRHNTENRMREYEYKNLVQCYKAYMALKGNSFIDHIYKEMQKWEII